MEIREGLTFDDVLLVPKFSDISSRSQTNLSTKLSRNISLNIPLISANMDTVTEAPMAVVMAREGGIGIIHRFLTIEEEVNQVLKVKRSGSVIIENPYTIQPEQTIQNAFNLMDEKGVSGLVVTNADSTLAGILTERDVLFESSNSSKLVMELMTKDVITAHVGIDMEQAKLVLKNNRIEKLPLIDENNHVKGLITSQDIADLEKYPDASKDKKGRPLVGAAVGVKGDFMERTEALIEAETDVLVVDIAHGHSENAINTVKNIKKAFGIDLHTGLGPSGYDTILVPDDISLNDYQILKRLFGDHVAALDPSKSVGYKITGDIHTGIVRQFTTIEWLCITQEFGTYNPTKVFKNLRAENRWTQNNNLNNERSILDHWSRSNLLNTFNPKDEVWQEKIINRGNEVFQIARSYIARKS